MNKDKEKKGLFCKALQETKGIISEACKRVGISRTLYYQWRKKDLSFANQVNEILEEQVDYVESKLLEQIDQGNITAIIFYLKSKGWGKISVNTKDFFDLVF